MSTAIAVASPPAERIAPATVSALSAWRSATTTRAPAAARRWAIASPIPCAAPVTTATWPSSSMAATSGASRQGRADRAGLIVDPLQRRHDIVDAGTSSAEDALVEPDRLVLAGPFRHGEVHRL